MNATPLFLCIMTLSLISITIPAQSQTDAGGGASATGSRETEKAAMPRKADSNVMPGGSPAGKPKQIPAPPDRSQVVEERLRSGQMEKPIAQGEVSDRLNQMYSGSSSPVQ
jgi:hypothetical protein